jgi:hypothetical protein
MNTVQNVGDQVRHRVQTELVDVLERTRLVRGQASRQLLLDELRDRLGQLALREHAELRLQVVELVRACTRMADGVHALVGAVEHLEPGTDEVHSLRRLRDEWEVADVLTGSDWVELRPVLETLYPENLTVLCQRATRHRLPGPPPWCANAWHCLVHLGGQNAGPEGVPPSMAFLSLLEDQVDDQLALLIRRRNQRLAAQQGLTRHLDRIRVELTRGAEQPRDSTAYLVIQVEPRLEPDGGDDAYTLSSFRQWHGGDTLHSRQGESRLVRRHELEREVEQLIDLMETEWSDRTGNVVVEFVLPWKLLNADVDWWRKEIDSERPIVLAMDYPVVVRSLERLRTPRWHRHWRQRWQQLQSAPTSSVVHWSQPSGADYFTRLETELKGDGRIVSLVLSEPPTMPGDTGQQEVEAALRAGLPVIIWHRADCSSEAFREAVFSLVADSGLAELPGRAKELRHQALRLEPDLRIDHIGRHLTVLWDDPARRPGPLGGPSGRRSGETR